MSFFTGCQVDSNEDEKATYTVTYNANGGSGEMKALTAEEGTEITLTANAFTREGYTFSGWNTAADGKGKDYADKSTIKLTAETTFYAKWNPNAYKVMFCDDSGNADDAIIETTYDTEFALPETTTMSKTGYNFYGWNTEPDGSGKNFKPGEKVKNLTTEAGTVTLYVCWLEKGAHTITYVLNDGINDESNPEIFLERNAVELKEPSRTFYEFAGWYDNADFSGEKLTGWNAGEKTGDITLYAKWTITADSVSEAIKNIPADGNVHTVVLAGEISEDIITAIRKALIAKPEIKVNLDLSGTTGLTEIPAWAFFDEDEWTACEALAGIVLPEGMESINEYAFFFCPNLTDIVIPDSVKTIGKQAFNQSGLTSIKFGSGLESIGRFAFQACNLTKITVPGNVKTIIHGAFDACVNLEEAVLEEGVQTIGEVAFASCEKLSAVTIPKSVTSIGNSAFSFGSGNSLQTVNYGGTMAEWNALKASIGTSNDVLLNAAIICTDGSLNTDAVSVINRLGEGEHTVTVTGEVSAEYLAEIAEAIKEKDYRDTKIILDMSGTTGLESIPEMTFYNNFGLVEIVLPQSVTSIKKDAFMSCIELKSVKIGRGVTKIGDSAFMACTSLTSIEIPDNVTSVGEYIFQSCESLKEVTIGKGLASISSSMFFLCSALEKIVIPAEVKSIEDYAFGDCTSLADVCYGGTVAEWNALKNDGKIDSTGNDALLNATIHCTDGIAITADKAAELITSLESGEYNIAVSGEITDVSAIKTALQTNENAKVGLDLSQTTGLIAISNIAFNDCSSLTSVNIPNSVTSIGNSAFNGCSNLASVNIPDSVTSIGNFAFNNCSSLTTVTILEGVTSIGEYAFYGCSNLASISIPDSVNSIGYAAFTRCSSLTSVNIPDGVTSIANTTFHSCSSLTSVNIPDSVTSIGDSAFGECESLTSINIPNSVTSIDRCAFRNCSNLTTIVIPDSVDFIGERVFEGCTNLTELTVSEGNQKYESYENCIYTKTEKTLTAVATGLTSIKFLDGVTSIGEVAFYSCKNLASITIPNSVTSIIDYAFSYCSNLTSVTIPDSVTSIGKGVFMYSGLKSITIPDSITSIDKDVFSRCSLTEVTYKGTKAQWEAFGVNKGSITIHCSDGDI